jgi:ankyrin repeat protein
MSPDLSIWASNCPFTIRSPQVSGGFTALYFAAQQGYVDVARVLLDAGAEINDSHSEYGSPLLLAIASGHEVMALFLLNVGADPNVKDG